MSLLSKDRISELFKDNDDSQNRRRSLLLTTSITAILTFLFTILGFKTPLPLPAEEGTFVLSGFEDGNENDEILEDKSKEQIAEEITDEKEELVETDPITEETTEPEIETGDEDDAPVITAPKKPTEKPTEEKPTEKPTDDEEPTTPTKSEGEELADDLTDIFGANKSKPKGEEENTKRTLGDNALTYKKTSFGSVGIVDGTGLSLLNMPDIDEKTQENADVFIKIKVDRTGKVLEARNDVSRSTTTNLSLINKSIENAKKSTFTRTDLTSMITEAVLEYKYRLN